MNFEIKLPRGWVADVKNEAPGVTYRLRYPAKEWATGSVTFWPYLCKTRADVAAFLFFPNYVPQTVRDAATEKLAEHAWKYFKAISK